MADKFRDMEFQTSGLLLSAMTGKGYTVLIEPPGKGGRLMAVAHRGDRDSYIRVTGFSVTDVLIALSSEIEKEEG